MQSGSQATVDALLEELHAKDEHIKQLGAEMAKMAFSADVKQGMLCGGATANGGAAEAVAEARRETRVLKQKLEKKERELEHALGLRRKLGDSARKVAELRAQLEDKDRQLHELRHSSDCNSGDRFARFSAVDPLAMEEMMRELEQTRERAAAAEDGQRKAQARVVSLTKALEDARRGSALGLDRQPEERVEQATRHEPETTPDIELERKPEENMLVELEDEDIPQQLWELQRRLKANELGPEEAKRVRKRLEDFVKARRNQQEKERGQGYAPARREAVSDDRLPHPEASIDRQQRQRQQQARRAQLMEEEEEEQQQQQQLRAQKLEQRAEIVRSWGLTKEGEAARQKIRDEAHVHRMGWLKSGQVMQKFAWSSDKVQPRYVKLSTDSSAICWGSSMTSKLRSVPVRDIRDVYYGFTSEVFRRREAAAALSSVKEWHCFSLQLPDRTLDFAAPTDQEAVAWTICLRTLCYCQGVWEAGKPLVMGDVLWKRAALKFDDKIWERERERRPASAAFQMSRQEMEQIAMAVASAKLRRLYDAIEAGTMAAAEERQQLGYSRGEELSEDPRVRREKHMVQLAEMRRKELRAAARNIH